MIVHMVPLSVDPRFCPEKAEVNRPPPLSVSVQNYKELELLRLVYYGGVEHEIRKEVWPFLLGHYRFGMTKKEMGQVRQGDTQSDAVPP